MRAPRALTRAARRTLTAVAATARAPTRRAACSLHVLARRRAFFERRWPFRGFLPGLCQLGVEIGLDDAFQGAEIGARQGAGVESTQQGGALAASLLITFLLTLALLARSCFGFALGCALGGVGFAPGGLFSDAASIHQGAASRHFGHSRVAVFIRDLAGRLAVQIGTLRNARQRLQVRRARGVAVQKGRQ